MLDIGKIRGSFPFLASAVYLNTATAGLSWLGLDAAAAAFYTAKQRGICGREEWGARLAQARGRLGTLLGVPPRQVSFTGSATESLNLAILGLPLPRGSRIAVASDEFPSVLQPSLLLRERGVELVSVPVARESERSAALAAAVAAGARALAVSHVHWRTGTRVDLELLSAECRSRGAWLIVDGVQAVGAIPVRAGLADVYCGSSFKWLLAGFGLGFMAMGERLAREWTPPFRGYANEPPSRDPQYGHINYPGIYALDASLERLASWGWDAIHRRVARLAGGLAATLAAKGFEVIAPATAAAAIVSVRSARAADQVQCLARQSIYVEDRDGMLRASPHFYNTEDELDRFVAALQACSPQGDPA
jgi:selenocysteine lyase/cysteine desulfurase